ncbi:MAG: HypC/HybG/HupF family hydrogenase formation chaperone [Chitinophagaceae bacterium]
MCLAIPGRIRSIEPFKEGYMRMGKVELGGIVKEINLQLVPDAREDDYVLVHVGVAISIVDEEEAKSSLAFLKQMDELDELYNAPSDGEMSVAEMTKQGNEIISKMMS